jgi:hypothetical protein
MRWALGLCLLGLAACGRPMTPTEVQFARDVFGPGLDTSIVVVARGAGLTPPGKTRLTKVTRERGTERACVRVARKKGKHAPAPAFAFRNKVHFDTGLYSSDMVLEWPDALRVPNAIIFAHELTHVWQWQNRDRTGYTPFRALAESIRLVDPYIAASGQAEFFSYGYEQQAAMVEDYLCFAFANPNHPRRAELRAILAPVFPIAELDKKIGQ